MAGHDPLPQRFLQVDVERGELPCASQAACWLDVKRAYMALRPALRRMYVVVEDVATYWPVVEKLGFRPLADGVALLDGREYSTVVLDFGPGSVVRMPADWVHVSGCRAGKECVFYQDGKGKFDFKPVTPGK